MYNINTITTPFPALKSWFVKMSLPLVFLSMILLTPQANASNVSPNSPTAKKETVNRINAIQRDLTSIRQQTLHDNPELAEQAKQLEHDFQKKADEIGYEPEIFVAKAQEIQEQVKDTSLSEEARSELIKEFTAAKQKMAQQRQAILDDKALMAKQDKLQEEMMVAMKAQNPKTERLVEELNSLVKMIQ